MWPGRAYPQPQKVTIGIPLRCVQIASGRKHILALMEGGFVMSWGERLRRAVEGSVLKWPPYACVGPYAGVGYFGQLGHGDDQSYERPRMIHQLDPQRIGDQVRRPPALPLGAPPGTTLR
jgi:hypothetical protein